LRLRPPIIQSAIAAQILTSPAHELYEGASHLYGRIAEDFESSVKNTTSVSAKFLSKGAS